MTPLYIPEIDPDGGVLAAALRYVKAGWYVLPVKYGSKHPGSVVGFGWNDQSSREPEVIIAWFAGTDHGIALHCGRSGAVVIDLDNPAKMTPAMSLALLESDPPMQMTRKGDDMRGHYFYLQPEGRVLGNGVGKLGAGWGDVRGLNGVIIAAPSAHEAADGEYRWLRTGELHPMPAALADDLHDASPSEDAATDAQIAAFLAAHSNGIGTAPHLIAAWLATFRRAVALGESRHTKGLSIVAGALREAAAGQFSAAAFAVAMRAEFLAAVARAPVGKQGSARTGAKAEAEWLNVLAWAVGQASTADPVDTLTRLSEHAPGMVPWVKPTTPVTALATAVVAEPVGEPQIAAEPIPEPAPATDPLLDYEIAQQRVRRQAKVFLDNEEASAGFTMPPATFDLTAELALPRAEVSWRVAEVMPAQANVLLTAQFKAGKTTLINNFARALADGLPFLGQLVVAPLVAGERVGVWNYEVSRSQYGDWLRDAAIENTGAVAILNVRGYRMPLTSRHVENQIVAWLIERNVRVWVVDPFARAFTGKSENDNTEVGGWLDTLDVIKERAGVRELILATHTGRAFAEEGQERARGATRLDDWADVRWMLNKNDLGERFFSATGRDVEYAEHQLSFKESTRQLAIAGGDRAAARLERYKNAVMAAVHATPGMSGAEVRGKVTDLLTKAEHGMVDAAVASLVRAGNLRVEVEGPGKPNRHYPASPNPLGGLR